MKMIHLIALTFTLWAGAVSGQGFAIPETGGSNITRTEREALQARAEDRERLVRIETKLDQLDESLKSIVQSQSARMAGIDSQIVDVSKREDANRDAINDLYGKVHNLYWLGGILGALALAVFSSWTRTWWHRNGNGNGKAGAS